MAFFPIDPFPSEPPGPRLTTNTNPSSSNSSIAATGVIDLPRKGVFRRELLTWRTPHLGYVKMYLNPQELSIEDSKDITPSRTKGGFVVQYAGENMTQININGTTGSSGIEGINVLYSIYRAEQESFEGIALALDERLSVLQTNTLTGLSSFLDPNIFQLANDSLRNFGRPQPTLASLASNIELFFQGVLYRGYFTKFSVQETAESPGIFRYNLAFTAYARQGVRRNFMGWHRQPFNPAGLESADANPLSFPDIDEETHQHNSQPPPPRTTGNKSEANQGSRGPRDSASQAVVPDARLTRATNTAVDDKGQNLEGQDLRFPSRS